MTGAVTDAAGEEEIGAPLPEVDVVVVGAGPVGCVLALLLGRRGHRVLLVERHSAPYPLPRAVHFDDEAARILQGCGLGDDLPALTEPATTYEWRNAQGVPLLRFEMPLQGGQGWPSANMFNQPDLEARLLAEAEACHRVTLWWGQAALDVGDDADGAWVDLAPSDGRGAHRRVGAAYVVGCDGANSTVRRALGVGFEDRGFFFDWLVVDVRLHQPRVFDPPNLQVCDPARPTTVVSGGPGRRRWEFMCLPGESLDTLDAEDSVWAFLAPWDVRPDNAELVRHAGYRFGARWATSWHVGRVFLAGDAAHQTPPFAGQGMCAGLRDATNLAWKLDHVLRCPEHAALLETYDVERIPQAAAVIEIAAELGKVICIPDAEAAAARDAAMAPLVPPGGTPAPAMPGLSGGMLGSGPHTGELFVQGRIRLGGAVGRFDDVVGAGWQLVLAHPGARPPDEETTWLRSALGGHVVAMGDEAEDLDGCYARWFADHGVVAALQRPDFSLYATARTDQEVTALLTELRSHFDRLRSSAGTGGAPPDRATSPAGPS